MKLKKGTLANLNVIYKDLKYVFGTGGLHASVHGENFQSNEKMMITDIDVEGFYPSVANAYNLSPSHLGDSFSSAYKSIPKLRAKYEKGTPENKLYKLAGNGAYGNSNNTFSALYDPKFTMTITVNGQMMLCMLIESLSRFANMRVIQVNTDGVTIYHQRKDEAEIKRVISAWEKKTKMKMEYATYSAMYVKDVNNYIAFYTNGEVKLKGTYVYQSECHIFDKTKVKGIGLGFHQNHDALIIPEAVFNFLSTGQDIKDFIMSSRDSLKFLLSCRAKGQAKILITNGAQGKFLQDTIRFFISKKGYKLYRKYPPIPPATERNPIGVHTGKLIKLRLDSNEVDWDLVDWDFYIDEAVKLLRKLGVKYETN
jgi:hypothetical protein